MQDIVQAELITKRGMTLKTFIQGWTSKMELIIS
jgi:hypothetical protein